MVEQRKIQKAATSRRGNDRHGRRQVFHWLKSRGKSRPSRRITSDGGEIHYHLRSLDGKSRARRRRCSAICPQPALVPASPWLDSIAAGKTEACMSTGEKSPLTIRWENGRRRTAALVGVAMPDERQLDDGNFAGGSDQPHSRQFTARRHLPPRRGPAGQFERADGSGAEKISPDTSAKERERRIESEVSNDVRQSPHDFDFR